MRTKSALSPSPRSFLRRILPSVVLGLGVGVVGLACGGDPEPTLDAQASRGRQVAREAGCTSCHTAGGSRSEGPTWKGLAGSTVTLADGRSVTADDAYLTKAITDPRSEAVQGFRNNMPTNSLKPDEVAAIVAYIKALK